MIDIEMIRCGGLSVSRTYQPHDHVIAHSVANIRRRLAGAVQPQDQILLIGPPYKVLRDSLLRSEDVLKSLRLGDEEDGATQQHQQQTCAESQNKASQFGSAERTGSRRIFLFSKLDFVENSVEAPPCTLEPMDLTLPTEPDPSPVAFPWVAGQQQLPGQSSTLSGSPVGASPLHQALEVYERRFMLNLCRGRALADGADVRLASMRNCVSEMIVMARALRAAVSNLSDHRNGAARTRAEFASAFQTTSAEHAGLLQRFEGRLADLATISLHPSLVGIARASGRVMETLLDTVPVERERAWMQRCQTSHQRLAGLFAELEGEFGRLGSSSEWEEIANEDSAAEDEIAKLVEEIETAALEICMRQGQRLNQLTSEHGEVTRVIVRAVSDDDGSETTGDSHSQEDAQAAFVTLEKISKGSVDVLPSMEIDDAALRDMMARVADGKTTVMRRMQRRLRDVSSAQSGIQRIISSVGVLRDALTQQSEDMAHLTHISELPAAYRGFLNEIRRRRAYGEAVSSTSEAMIQRLASMRSDEVKAREGFLRGCGRHLMPAFFEVFLPTLATPPPLFTPQLPSMVELDTLPDVSMADGAGAGSGAGAGASSSDSGIPLDRQISADNKGVSSASTLTDSQPQEHEGKGSDAELAGVSGAVAAAAGGSGDMEQHLIVCADDASNNIIMDTGGHEVAADAVRKTLQYENFLLRQAIERMGGKTPKTYIDESHKQRKDVGLPPHLDTPKNVLDENFTALKAELEATRKELEEEKAKATAAATAVATAATEAAASANNKRSEEGGKKKICDKISHSSFAVGDVGLFMPTGRPGKRTYLAFHTNCPHRYLSTDSIKGSPDYVLGRIVYQEELIAGDSGTDSNPYGLHPGTKFWILTVEVLKVPGSRSSSA